MSKLQVYVEMEANLAKVTFDYIPQSQIRRVYASAATGDIVAIATNITGRDATHTGLVYRHPDGNSGLIHASPMAK
jgi:ABC-type transport system involved in Fe-S cluster assembly fused permease/ATPase subunit